MAKPSKQSVLGFLRVFLIAAAAMLLLFPALEWLWSVLFREEFTYTVGQDVALPLIAALLVSMVLVRGQRTPSRRK